MLQAAVSKDVERILGSPEMVGECERLPNKKRRAGSETVSRSYAGDRCRSTRVDVGDHVAAQVESQVAHWNEEQLERKERQPDAEPAYQQHGKEASGIEPTSLPIVRCRSQCRIHGT